MYSQIAVASEEFEPCRPIELYRQVDVAAEEFSLDICCVEEEGATVELVDMTVEHAIVNQRKRKHRNIVQTIRRQAQQISRLSEDLAMARQSIACYSRADDRKQLMPYNGLQLAVKRNVAHASSSCIAAISSHPCHRSSVVRWENKLGASLIANSYKFHSEMESQFAEPCDGLNLAVCCFKGDATKSSAWKNHKVQALSVKSTYVIGGEHSSKTVWTDTLVADDCSGKGIERMVRKQLRSVGCNAMDATEHSIPECHIRLIICAGDDGPDQQMLRKTILESYRPSKSILVSCFSCLMHHQSLGEKRVLSMLDCVCKAFPDKLAFYSGMVQISNLLRSKPVDVMNAAKLFDPSSGAYKTLSKTKMKIMAAARWGYTWACEEAVMAVGQDDLLKMINDVFGYVKIAQPRQSKTDVRDDEKVCEYQAYRERQSRWFTDARRHARSPWFWVCMELNHNVKKPWHHFLCFLQKKQFGLEWDKTYGTNSTHTSVLVATTDADIKSEFEELLSDEFWMPSLTAWAMALEKPDEELLWCAIVSMALCSYSEYIFRISMRISSWPFKLMVLVQSRCNIRCPKRKACAAELLGEDTKRLDMMSAKSCTSFTLPLLIALALADLTRNSG